MFRTEISYIDKGITKWGKKGSVRIDVIEYNPNGTIKAVYDLKTGGAKLTDARKQQIRNELNLPEDVPIYEIKPDQASAN